MQAERPLDEVMLAMDVVDTLRHQKILVDRELNADQRDQDLILRLREIYASQGIEVSDDVLQQGVDALQQDRFRYTPSSGGVQHFLAAVYVKRAVWGKRLFWAVLAILLMRGTYYFTVERPRNQHSEQAYSVFQQQAEAGHNKLNSLQEKLSQLRRNLDAISVDDTVEWRVARDRLLGRARDQLAETDKLLAGATSSMGIGTVAYAQYRQDTPGTQLALAQNGQRLQQAGEALNQAQSDLLSLRSLADLPATLAAQRESVDKIARMETARQQAEQYYSDAIAALIAGDLDAATRGLDKLEALRLQLTQSYRIRIVSDEEEYSGIWRTPPDKPGVKNYYLIVEAVADDGRILSLPILNEEDGKTYSVPRWGIRVSKSVFKRVLADKKDDGIIQMRELGSKPSGYLQAELNIKTQGASITSW